jgi:hypothetical protein
MILLAADGVPNQQIAELVDVSRTTVIVWRERYLERGLDGLTDRDRPGRPREFGSGRDHRRHAHAAKPWCDALVDSDARRPVEVFAGVGGAGVARVRDQATEG